MASAGSHHWVREYFLRTIASAEFRDFEDYQYGWLCRLRLHAFAREGYLPTDVSELWRLAGAKTMRYFEEKSQSVLAFFDGRTVDGLRMFNSFDLRELKDCRKKLRLPEEEDVSLSLPGIGVAVVDPEDQSVTIEKIFAFYCVLFQRDPERYRLTPQRQEKAGIRLWERIKARGGNRSAAVQDCRDAIANLKLSDWHVENGHIDWTDQIFRSQDVFEKRLAMNLGGEAAIRRQPKSEPYSIAHTATPAPVAEQQIAQADDPWRKALVALAAAVNPHSFDTWLKPTRFYALVEKTLYVRVPTREFKTIGDKYPNQISAALRQVMGPDIDVVYVTNDEARARAKEAV
jgi:hypothetical protein